MSFSTKILATLASLMLATLGTSLSASPSMAHDSLTDTSPSSGEVVEAGQFEVSITSAEEIINLADMSTNDISVVGPLDNPTSGIVSAPCIRVSGKTASVPVEIAEPGTYRATWQIVSSDGHPVSGQFQFEVTNTAGYVSRGFDSLPSDCKPIAMATTTDSTSGTLSEDGNPQQDSVEGDSGQWIGLLVGIGFVVFASIAGALTVKLREIYRAKKPRKLDQD